MSTQYLLPCSCGSATPVQTAQAGESIRCTCGAELKVPTLRALRNLPPVPHHQPQLESTWNPGLGLVFLGGLAVLASMGLFVYVEMNAPTVDLGRVRQEASYMSPAESWQKWNVLQEGLPGPYSKESRAVLAGAPQRKRMFLGGCVLAAVGAGVIGGGVYLLKRPRPTAYSQAEQRA